MKVTPATSWGELLGTIVRLHAHRHDITQADVAEAVGVSPSTWSRHVRGVCSLRVDQLAAAAEKVKVSPCQLVEEASQLEHWLTQRGVSVVRHWADAAPIHLAPVDGAWLLQAAHAVAARTSVGA